MKAAVIIPVFNEGERVLPVIEAALDSNLVKEVIVVEDGSTDRTAVLLSEWSNEVAIQTHARNLGKGEALDTGMQLVKARNYSNVVFLDGDLKGIRSIHIDSLLEPIIEDNVLMSIGYLGLRKAFVKQTIYQRWGVLSGQRAIQAAVWDTLSKKDKQGFAVEAALNARLRKAGEHHRIARIALEGVSHVGKRDKEANLLKAAVAYGKTYGVAALTYARIELEQIGIK
jgi:glycosyltransferase involved in cell wall biosynthesis